MAGELPDFSAQEVSIINAWLDKHWHVTARGCPICHNSSWNINTKLSVMPCASVEGTVTMGEIIPSVNVNCNKCGYLIQFNAIKMGIWKAKKEQEAQSGEGDG